MSERCQVIADRLTRLESRRGIEFKFSPIEARLMGWVKAGITDPQLREAYELALAERIDAGSPGAINYGFLDTFVRKVIQDEPASALQAEAMGAVNG